MIAVLSTVAGGLVSVLYQNQQLKEKRRQSEAKAESLAKIVQGQADMAAGNWREATLKFGAVLARIGPEASLSAERNEAEALHQEAKRRWDAQVTQLNRQAKRQEVRDRLADFRRLRDEAFFEQSRFSGEDPAARSVATEGAARKALALFGAVPGAESTAPVPGEHLTPDEVSEVTTGCYELLLTLADAVVSTPLGSGPEEARQRAGLALRVLEAAPRFGRDTRAFHHRRARYFSLRGDEAGARAERERADALQPASATDYFLMGTEGSAPRHPDRAVHDFESALRLQPDYFWAQYGLATCYLKLHQWTAAKVSLTACLGLRPGFAWLYPLRALAHGELGEFAAAEADLREAERGHADDATRYSLYVGRGVLRVRQGRLDDAVSELRAAITLRPGWYHAYANLAQALRKQLKREQAIELLGRAIAAAPADSRLPLFRERARVHLERRDTAAALRDLDEAIRLETPGGSSDALASDHLERGRILASRGSYPEAARAYGKALEARPGLVLALRGRAQALIALAEQESDEGPRQEQYREAVRDLTLCLTAGRPAADILRVRGQVRAKLDDYSGGVEDYTSALVLEPDAATHAARGWLYLAALEAPGLALRDFEKCLRLDPNHANAYNGRGAARLRLGHDIEAAVADAEECSAAGPRSRA